MGVLVGLYGIGPRLETYGQPLLLVQDILPFTELLEGHVRPGGNGLAFITRDNVESPSEWQRQMSARESP